MNTLLPLLLAVSLACVYGASIDVAKCGPVCMMYCPFGNVMDANDCPLCECNPMSPLALATSNPCSHMLMCMMYCEKGFQTGSNGCNICKCN